MLADAVRPRRPRNVTAEYGAQNVIWSCVWNLGRGLLIIPPIQDRVTITVGTSSHDTLDTVVARRNHRLTLGMTGQLRHQRKSIQLRQRRKNILTMNIAEFSLGIEQH